MEAIGPFRPGTSQVKGGNATGTDRRPAMEGLLLRAGSMQSGHLPLEARLPAWGNQLRLGSDTRGNRELPVNTSWSTR